MKKNYQEFKYKRLRLLFLINILITLSKKQIPHILFILSLLLSIIPSKSVYGIGDSKTILTRDESNWLYNRGGVVRMGITEIPPQIIKGKDKGTYKGIAIDYINLVEKNTGCKFEIVYFDTWKEVLEASKERNIDVVFSAQQTPERLKYLVFSDFYFELPNMIITRTSKYDSLTLDKMEGYKIAVSDGSAVQEYIKAKYPSLSLIPVEDELTGLMKVSIGEIDAIVSELSRASYYIEKAKLTNLSVAGNAGLIYQLRFACRNDYPMLLDILNKGLSGINEEQRKTISTKWLSVYGLSQLSIRNFKIAVVLGGIFYLLIILWNRALNKRVKDSTVRLQNELFERKKAQYKLRDSEERYRSLFENASVPIWEEDFSEIRLYVDRLRDEGVNDLREYFEKNPKEVLFCVNLVRILDVNQESIVFFKVASKDELIKCLSEYFIEESLDVFKEEILCLANGDLKFESEIPVKMITGEIRYFIIRLSVLPGHEISLSRVHVSFIDITERKTAEEKFTKAFNYAPVAMAMYSIDNDQYFDVNNKFTEVFGFKRQEVLGKNPIILGLVGEAEIDLLRDSLNKHSRIIGIELDVTKKNGETIRCIYSGEIITIRDQKYIFSITQDITTQRLLEAQLQQAQKMEAIGQLAGGIAHDFNNKLTVILGYTQLIKKMKCINTQYCMENLDEVITAGIHSKELIRKLLTFSRKEAIMPVMIYFQKAMSEIQKSLGMLTGEHVNINWDVDDNVWPIKIDPVQLDQIVMNMASNARDAMPSGGEFTISAVNEFFLRPLTTIHGTIPPGEYVRISFTDTGCGMKKEIIEHIFEPFFTTKGVENGTGMGLSTIFGIVTQNNGHLIVESKLGIGSMFSVFFPRATSENFIVSEEKNEDSEINMSASILIIEDEKGVRNIIRRMLENLGYSVMSSSSVEDAIALCEDMSILIDCVLTDVIMPGMNGIELQKRISLIRGNLPFVFMSGYTADIMKDVGFEYGDIDFVSKPINFIELNKKIQNNINRIKNVNL